MADALLDLSGYVIGELREEVIEHTLQNATSTYVPGFSALTMYYSGRGNALITIEGEFTKTTKGVLLIEVTRDGGKTWKHRDCQKLGRGMSTSATNAGPARFRTDLDDEGRPSGIRIRCQDTKPMEAIPVSIFFAGARHQHLIRAEPDYVIQEEP